MRWIDEFCFCTRGDSSSAQKIEQACQFLRAMKKKNLPRRPGCKVMNDMPNCNIGRTRSYAPSLQGSLEIKDRFAQPMAENLLVFEITE